MWPIFTQSARSQVPGKQWRWKLSKTALGDHGWASWVAVWTTCSWSRDEAIKPPPSGAHLTPRMILHCVLNLKSCGREPSGLCVVLTDLTLEVFRLEWRKDRRSRNSGYDVSSMEQSQGLSMTRWVWKCDICKPWRWWSLGNKITSSTFIIPLWLLLAP